MKTGKRSLKTDLKDYALYKNKLDKFYTNKNFANVTKAAVEKC